MLHIKIKYIKMRGHRQYATILKFSCRKLRFGGRKIFVILEKLSTPKVGKVDFYGCPTT